MPRPLFLIRGRRRQTEILVMATAVSQQNLMANESFKDSTMAGMEMYRIWRPPVITIILIVRVYWRVVATIAFVIVWSIHPIFGFGRNGE